MARDFDVLVIGGGPAGAAAAGLLAGRGHRVMLLDHGRPRRAMPFESALPSLARAQLPPALLQVVMANVQPGVRHGHRWGGAELQWLDDDPGWTLPRERFDAALRAWACGAGAELGLPAAVHGPLPEPGRPIAVVGPQGTMRIAARAVVLATGRALAQGLAAHRTVLAGPDLAAFCLRGNGVADGAVVEALADGWTWCWPHAGAQLDVGVFVDGAELRREGWRQLCARMLGESRGPVQALRADHHLLHAVRATAQLREPAGTAWAIGDAASTLDPLSSQGVEKALASAAHAALCLDHALRDPADAAQARRHHATWEHNLFLAHQRATAAHYTAETRFAERPFWRVRRAPATSPSLPARLQAAPEVRVVDGLRTSGERVHPEPCLELPDGRVLSHLGRTALVPLWRAFTTGCAPLQGIAHAGRDPRLFVLPPQQVADAVAWLWQNGALNGADRATGGR